jgi:hypothetical protein
MKFALAMLLCCLLLSGCVGTIIGAAASGAVAVTSAVITAPIKIGGAVIDAVSDEDEDEDEDEEDSKSKSDAHND